MDGRKLYVAEVISYEKDGRLPLTGLPFPVDHRTEIYAASRSPLSFFEETQMAERIKREIAEIRVQEDTGAGRLPRDFEVNVIFSQREISGRDIEVREDGEYYRGVKIQ